MPAVPGPAYRSTKDGDIAMVHLEHAPGKTGEVALFLPKGFDPAKPAILMPYFHGHGGGINDAFERQRLAELAAQSGKNIAFVIPQLGPKSDIRDDYRKPGVAAKFLDEAAGGLGSLYAQAHPGADAQQAAEAFRAMPVVPLSYSGGYQATWPTLALPQVKGVVLLDSMYGASAPFENFTRRGDAPFVSVQYGPSTAEHTKDFARNAAKGTAIVAQSQFDHPVLVQKTLGATLQSLSIEDGGKVTAAAITAPKAPATAASRAPGPS